MTMRRKSKKVNGKQALFLSFMNLSILHVLIVFIPSEEENEDEDGVFSNYLWKDELLSREN